MKKLVAIFLFLPALLHCQTWEKTFGGDRFDCGYSVQQTNDGGYIITGKTITEEDYHGGVYIVKTDNSGNSIWEKIYDGNRTEVGHSVRQTNDDGYIIAGWINYDVYLVKTDEDGDTLWSKTIGSGDKERGYSVQQTNDGGYIVTGYTDTFGNGAEDVFIIKTNNTGDTLWTKAIGGIDEDVGRCIQQTTDGGYIVTGHTKSFGYGYSDVYLIKTNSEGESLWTKTYGGAGSDYGYSLQQTTDGGYIICGFSSSFGNFDKDIYLIKTDESGDTLWTRVIGGEGIEVGESVQQTTDGGYIIAGTTTSYGNGSNDVYLIKTDNMGNTLWSRTFGGEDIDIGYSLHQTSDGGFIIAGSTESYGNQGVNLYLIKTDMDGNVLSTIEIPFNTDRKLVKTIDLSGREILKPVKNQPYIELYNDGSAEKKMKLK